MQVTFPLKIATCRKPKADDERHIVDLRTSEALCGKKVSAEHESWSWNKWAVEETSLDTLCHGCADALAKAVVDSFSQPKVVQP